MQLFLLSAWFGLDTYSVHIHMSGAWIPWQLPSGLRFSNPVKVGTANLVVIDEWWPAIEVEQVNAKTLGLAFGHLSGLTSNYAPSKKRWAWVCIIRFLHSNSLLVLLLLLLLSCFCPPERRASWCLLLFPDITCLRGAQSACSCLERN